MEIMAIRVRTTLVSRMQISSICSRASRMDKMVSLMASSLSIIRLLMARSHIIRIILDSR